MTETTMLPDIQSQIDDRGVELDRVGISGLYYPLTIREKGGGQQTVTACVALNVGLAEQQRGAHLSNLVEALHRYREAAFDLDDLVGFVRDVRRNQDRRGYTFEKAEICIRFKYFLPRAAPSSGTVALVPYDCGFDVALNGQGFKSIVVGVPIATVCPCSLAISDFGAHNQRANVIVQLWQCLDDQHFLWFENIIDAVESCASSQVHSVLKRRDEKEVTERMFRAPRFVEDVVRDVVVSLRHDLNDVRYNVRCESLESIHAHNAYAEASGVC
jgi:GTP cyclohydrolase IB